MTSDERREVLDGQLQTAMSDFDRMILDRQKALEEQRRDDPLPARADAGTGGGPGGSGSGTAEEASEAAGGGARSADRSTGDSPDAGGLEGGAEVSDEAEGEPPDAAEVPPDVGDGSDDDVVARQLREAAMNEKDPALREKLWDEYREYRKSAGKGGS